MDQNIVDPDPEMIYTKRKLHRMGANSYKTADDASDMASSSTPSPGTQWKPKIPSDGWGSSLEKALLFTRAEMDRHIGKSGKHIGGDKHAHHSVPIGFKKAKTTLKTNIYTIFTQTLTSSTFIIVADAFVVLKGTQALTI